MMNEEMCPYYRPPRGMYVPQLDDYVEGAAMCELVDKPCLLEHGDPGCCETYNEYLEELHTEEQAELETLEAEAWAEAEALEAELMEEEAEARLSGGHFSE